MIQLQLSPFDDELKPQPATNLMKTEEHSEAAAVFLQKLTAAVAELKEQLQHDYEQTYPGLGEIIRLVLDEEEAKAWDLSFFPHLFLPDMVEAHIATLGLEPVDTRHDNLVAPSTFVCSRTPRRGKLTSNAFA
jgi:hypothetical protein